MNLIFRMLYVYLYSLFRERLSMDNSKSRLPMIVLPNDLDINLHMNNGRYLTICDLNRIDLFIRSGLVKSMRKRKWIPVIAEHTMSYKKSLHLFERFTAELEVTHWDDKYFYMTHTFSTAHRVVATGTSKGAIRSRSAVIKPDDVLAAIEQDNKP
jgi:acyl-CoA thioesterase FadM